ncbi:hypothetical protein M9Y10_008540 [Tritrichomonas musculus]|uniref:Uncharacterized protein n=1 Tax=Tritrichomonas musculus TaxID=1915356 RepID=A0ABR2IZI7_9EUKA
MIIHFIISENSFENIMATTFLIKFNNEKGKIMDYFQSFHQEVNNSKNSKNIYKHCLYYSPKSRIAIDALMIFILYHIYQMFTKIPLYQT